MSNAARKTQIAHLSIDGEGLTDIARNIMLSEHPAKAWRLLAQHLVGEGTDVLARELLDGKRKLVGVNDLVPEPDNDKNYVADLKYIYAGRVRIGRGWWRPVAEVVRFGPDDAAYAARDRELMDDTDSVLDAHFLGQEVEARGAGSRWQRVWNLRVAFYAGPSERVVHVTVRKPRCKPQRKFLIFEVCGEPPFWWEENDSPEKALTQFLAAGRRLDERGAPHDDDQVEVISEAFASGVVKVSAAADLGLALGRKLREADEDRQHAEEDKRWRETIADLRARVLKQANGDMLDLFDHGKLVATVPRAPFIRWAMNRTRLRHLAPPWECCARSGLKLQLDDPYHSDWFFASTISDPAGSYVEIDPETGGPLRYPYKHDSPLEAAAAHRMFELQLNLGRFTCGVLVDGEPVTGIIGKDIVVLPDLHPDHLTKLVSARGVVTQAGGKLAHLAQVALERSIPMMLMPDACERLKDGYTVTLTTSEGRIRIHSNEATDVDDDS